MTKFFTQFLVAEKAIKSHFLTFNQRPDANYSRKELSQVDAYAVLVHAEMESYFESCADHAIDLADKHLKNDKYNRIIYSLGTFYAREPQEGQSILKVPQKDIWREKGGWALAQHRGVVKANNGIKIEDLCRIFIPLGLDVREIDQVLLVELDQFGALRGSTAHSSLRVRRGVMSDPFLREGEIKRLIGLLQTFDELFSKFVDQQGGRRRNKRKRKKI